MPPADAPLQRHPRPVLHPGQPGGRQWPTSALLQQPPAAHKRTRPCDVGCKQTPSISHSIWPAYSQGMIKRFLCNVTCLTCTEPGYVKSCAASLRLSKACTKTKGGMRVSSCVTYGALDMHIKCLYAKNQHICESAQAVHPYYRRLQAASACLPLMTRVEEQDHSEDALPQHAQGSAPAHP